MNKQVTVDLPCGVFYDLSYLVMDLNGTITFDGRLIDGVEDKLRQVAEVLDIHIITADTNQTAEKIKDALSEITGLVFYALETGRGDLQKLNYIEKLGRERTAAIGNGCNDALMLKEAALGICILGREGASTGALFSSKMVFSDIRDALDIFLKPNRMIATLRR